MDIKLIVIHCSASPQGRGDNAETIHQWHFGRGWLGIGYHYVLLEDGTIERGRPDYWQGAHVSGHNKKSLGICLIGEDSFTPDQFAALLELLDRLAYKYPDAEVVGHYELTDNKTCPNFDVQKWLTSGHVSSPPRAPRDTSSKP